MEELSDPLLMHILSFISEESNPDVLLVCKRFHRLLQCPLYYFVYQKEIKKRKKR